MTAENFRLAWTKDGNSLSPINYKRLINLNLQENSIHFLANSGLPTAAAPYLTFVTDNNDSTGIAKLTNLYEYLDYKYEKYIIVGSDGSGNAIVINTKKNDKIEWLDHENNFTPKFMNSSIETLAEFLLIYRHFIEQIILQNGENAYIDSNFSDSKFDSLIKKLSEADNCALTKNSFWNVNIEMLLGDRKNN